MTDFKFTPRPHPSPRVCYPGKRGEKRADKSYLVEVAGKTIGVVEQRMQTFERGSPDKRYVDRRWESPRWFFVPLWTINTTGFRSSDYETRKGAAEALFQYIANRETFRA